MPKELKSLLSCGLCHRPYDLATGLLPQELACRHSFCKKCVQRNTDHNSSECICNLCGYRTQLDGQQLPQSVTIMYLLRELPALILGRAMLDFSYKRSSTIEMSIEEAPSSPSKNWVEDINVESFSGHQCGALFHPCHAELHVVSQLPTSAVPCLLGCPIAPGPYPGAPG